MNRTSAPLLAAALALFAVAFLVLAADAGAHPSRRQIEHFWNPARMAAARPLEMTVGSDGDATVERGRSYSVVATPEVTPYAWNGQLFVRQGGKVGYCTATAIDSPSRSLVLTAGHCVHSPPRDGRPGVWSNYLEFVPGFNLGAAPFGTWVLSGRPRALPEWTREGNPDYDLGAFRVRANGQGVRLTNALGGGARIVSDPDRHQRFQTFGYPGATRRMRTCASGYAGDDPSTAGLPGPATVSVRCHWAPGASGGAWMIDGGTEIAGMSTYLETGDSERTFGPYFSRQTVGRLVAG